MKTIADIVAAQKNPPPRPIVAKVAAYCEKMKFGDVIERRELEDELVLTRNSLKVGNVSVPLTKYRHVTRVGPRWMSYYGSPTTIKSLRKQLAELENI